MNLGIFIGVGNYTSQQYNDLPACNKDAETLKSVFESIKNFTEILFLNGIVDQSKIIQGMEKLSTKYKNEEVEELIFYFSGHGEKEGDEFLYLPSDFDPHKKLGTSISCTGQPSPDTFLREFSNSMGD